MASTAIVATATRSAVRLETASGKPIRSLKHGQYRIVMRDRSRQCGFSLRTSVAVVASTGKKFVGTVSREVTLKVGDYTYSCGNTGPAKTLHVR